MDVLFVTAALPYPPNSGATIRTYNLLRRLGLRHRLHLVAFGDSVRDAAKIVALRSLCASIKPVPRRDSKGTPVFYLQLLLNLLSRSPVAVSRFTRPAMTDAIRRLVQTSPPDLVCCDFITLSPNLPPELSVPVHLTAHNVESMIWHRYYQHERNPVKALYAYLQYRKMLRFERRALTAFEHVACVSQEDLERLRELCPFPQYTVVPNGVDLDYFRPRPAAEVPYRLVFTGSMDWRPNQDAVRFFLRHIYPRIKAAEPRTSVFLVGRQPPARLVALAASYPDVSLVGTVPDMRPYLASAAVYVVPLRVGGGTRLKILEAMAMARPVVSTKVGAEGLTAIAGRDLLIADDPDTFAATVLRLFREPRLKAAVADAGHRLVTRAYGWDQIAAELDEAWHKAALAGRG